jgi:hypothetical protein
MVAFSDEERLRKISHFAWLAGKPRISCWGLKTQKNNKELLENFFQIPWVAKAGEELAEGCALHIHVDRDCFLYERRKNRNSWKLGSVTNPDFEFWVPSVTLRYLVELANKPETGIAAFGVAVFERILRGSKDEKIRFRVYLGLLSIWSKGYFSVLKLGGPEVASYLAQWGFHSVGKIKEVLKNSRG